MRYHFPSLFVKISCRNTMIERLLLPCAILQLGYVSHFHLACTVSAKNKDRETLQEVSMYQNPPQGQPGQQGPYQGPSSQPQAPNIHQFVTTTFDLPGFRVVRNLGVVRGIIVRSRSVV